MANRYSRTGFTKREEIKLLQIGKDLMTIAQRRSGKQDNLRALAKLFDANVLIKDSIRMAREWKNE